MECQVLGKLLNNPVVAADHTEDELRNRVGDERVHFQFYHRPIETICRIFSAVTLTAREPGRAMTEAVRAAVSGIPLEEAAQRPPEPLRALSTLELK